MKNKSFRPAFTLAEVLITMSIIGVVAVMIIPALVQNVGNKEAVTGTKNAFYTFSHAYALALLNNGTPENWNLIANASGAGAINGLNMIAPYLKIIKNCGVASGCFPDVEYKSLSGTPVGYKIDSSSNHAKAILADGTLALFFTMSPTCAISAGTDPALQGICAILGVDINGFKQPNQYGKDFFLFYLTKTGVVPMGGPGDTSIWAFSKSYDSGVEGDGLAAWVIYNENLDYLKCFSSLSWTGKTKCD